MSKTAFERDNILTSEERAKSARKCLSILSDAAEWDMGLKDYDFLLKQRLAAQKLDYAPSERVLAWLRDILSRFID